MMTKVTNERLAEMLAGLEGVTLGPWHEGDHWVFVPPASGVTSHALENVLGSDKPQANAAHIARCDPDTIRSILTELLSLRNAQSEAVAVKALMHQVHKMLGYHIVSPPTPDHQFVNVCNGDLRVLAELFEACALTHPAPQSEAVAVKALSDLDLLYVEMTRRMDQPKYLDQEGGTNPDWLPVDDTQVGVEFAFEFLSALTRPTPPMAVTDESAKDPAAVLAAHINATFPLAVAAGVQVGIKITGAPKQSAALEAKQ